MISKTLQFNTKMGEYSTFIRSYYENKRTLSNLRKELQQQENGEKDIIIKYVKSTSKIINPSKINRIYTVQH